MTVVPYSDNANSSTDSAQVASNTSEIAKNANDINSVGLTLAAMNTANTTAIATNTSDIAFNATNILDNYNEHDGIIMSNLSYLNQTAATVSQHTSDIAGKAAINGDETQAFSANQLTIKHAQTLFGVQIREMINSGFTNAVIELKDNLAELNESNDEYANVAVREVYLYNPTAQGLAVSTTLNSLTASVSSNTSNVATNTADLDVIKFGTGGTITCNHNHTTSMITGLDAQLSALTASGTVAQVKYVQTRDRYLDSGGNHVGLTLIKSPNVTDVHVDKLDVQITPKAANNKIIVEFVVNYNLTGDIGDYGFIVKRFDGTTRTTLALSEDSATDYFTVIASPTEFSEGHRGMNCVVKIVDENSLSVATTYELYARVTDSFSSSATSIFYLNGPAGEHPYDAGGGNSSREGMLSVATLTEIRA